MRLNQTESKQQVSSKTATKNENRKINVPQAFHLQTMYKQHKCNLIFTFQNTLAPLIEYYSMCRHPIQLKVRAANITRL